MLKPGDRISFVDEEGGGTVTRIEHGLAYVEIEAGLTIPTPVQNCAVSDDDDYRKYDEAGFETKPADERKPEHRTRHRDEPLIVDLHVKEHSSRSPFPNVIEEQLACFHRVMRRNAGIHGRVIVFIHGKGEGILRARLQKELDECYPNCIYEDAPFFSHGINGATKVRVR